MERQKERCYRQTLVCFVFASVDVLMELFARPSTNNCFPRFTEKVRTKDRTVLMSVSGDFCSQEGCTDKSSHFGVSVDTPDVSRLIWILHAEIVGLFRYQITNDEVSLFLFSCCRSFQSIRSSH